MGSLKDKVASITDAMYMILGSGNTSSIRASRSRG